ncbi:MAG: HAMP domain-containing protein [bacterium]|nr:HAMP domain-containing protein [bacterium]
MNFLRNLKIKMKLRIPVFLQLLLIIVCIYFYFTLNSLIETQEAKKELVTGSTREIREFFKSVGDYLNQKESFNNINSKLKKTRDNVAKDEELEENTAGLVKLKNYFKEIERRFNENKDIEKKIMELTDFSIKQSNSFIEQVSAKLATPARRRSVTTLERRMLVSANMNTAANYKTRLLFLELKEKQAESNEKAIITFLDSAIKNADTAATALANTPFKDLPGNAKKANQEIKKGAQKFIANMKKIGEIKTEVSQLDENLHKGLDQLEASQNASIFESIRWVFYELFIALLFVTIVMMYLGLKFSKLITTPILEMIERAYDLAVDDVDMTKRLNVAGKDEIAELAGWFNKFLERLHSIISKVRESSDDVFTATGRIANSSDDLAARTDEQASSITQTSSTLEEFTSSVRENTENSAEADMMLTSFNEDIQEKKVLIENVTNTMTEIFESSKQIDNIIKVINEISFQTNLLALNAAVEAARAGEAGRGFAVVASEVRNLAQKTAESSRTIQEIVLNNVESTQKGMKLVQDTSEFFAEIVGVMGDIVTKISNITNSSREQSTGIEQINKSIAYMNELSTTNASLVLNLANAGKDVKDNAVELRDLVSRFKVDQSSDIKGSDYFSEIANKQEESAGTNKKETSKSKDKKKKASRVKEKKKTKAKKKVEKKAKPIKEKKNKSKTVESPKAASPTEEDFFSTNDEFEEF